MFITYSAFNGKYEKQLYYSSFVDKKQQNLGKNKSNYVLDALKM